MKTKYHMNLKKIKCYGNNNNVLMFGQVLFNEFSMFIKYNEAHEKGRVSK